MTIPSIGRVFRRLKLLALCGHVALLNGCLPHADTFFKAAVTLLPDAPPHEPASYGAGCDAPHTEARVVAFVRSVAQEDFGFF